MSTHRLTKMQRGIWIDEDALRAAGLVLPLQIIVESGVIRVVPAPAQEKAPAPSADARDALRSPGLQTEGSLSEDDLFEDAVRLVVTSRRASTSMLQRKFSIGYTRAARLIDMMEERGIVSALSECRPREVLISRERI